MAADPREWDLAFVQSAARYAEDAHADDVRKGSNTPYISHLWSVAALVMEHGGNDRQVAAALLHDVVEDHGGESRLADVRARFGDDVADMVADLSDSTADTTSGETKRPWTARKVAYIEHLAQVEQSTALVSAADKLHNLRTIVSDYRQVGPPLWERFTQRDPAAHRWYYGNLIDILGPIVPAPMAFELRRSLADLDALMAEMNPESSGDWKPAPT